MRLDKFTIKAQETLQAAQNLAMEAQHSELLPLHLLAALLALRAQLCEIDCRFSQLAPAAGLCTQLAPHLCPIAPTPEDVDQARTEPPASTRAGIRGRYIRRYAGRPDYTADWTGICNANGRRLDLSHPFGQNAKWLRAPAESLNEAFPLVDGLFRAGRYAAVLDLLPLQMAGSMEQLETYILACARMGLSREARAGLDRYQGLCQSRFSVIALSLCALVSLGLAPAVNEMFPLITEGDQLLRNRAPVDDYHGLLYAQNKGRALSAAGRHEEAIAVLTEELALPRTECRPRNRSRVQIYLAEAHRCRGGIQEAVRLSQIATTTYQQEHLTGDLADYAFPLAAKLHGDNHAARQALDQAAGIQIEHHNELGLARVLCLKARRLGVTDDLPRIRELVARVAVLRNCPLAARVLAEFDPWVHPDRSDGARLDYWGV